MTAIHGADDAYFDSRLAYDERRSVVWQTLWEEVFSRYLSPTDSVVDLGAGWCDFINNVQARRRIAVVTCGTALPAPPVRA